MYLYYRKKLNKTNIVLLGFPGAGKSTIGKQLANKLQYTFIDTDRYFEEKYRFSIFDFFEQIGEEMFRQLEHQLLNDLLSKKQCVIATGGGTPCFFDNMEQIKRSSISVYIQLSPTSLYHRLQNSKRRRPLTKNLNSEELNRYIFQELSKREIFYKQADFIIKGENFDLNELIKILPI